MGTYTKYDEQAYFTDEDNFIPRGEYKETGLDKRKKQADALITSIDGDYYSLYLNRPIEIRGTRGVKRYNENRIAVSESVLKKLEKEYTIECDF